MRRLPLFLLFLFVRPLAAQTVFFPAGDVFRQPLAEFYDGRVPHGQFFEEVGVRYAGAGVVFIY